MKISKDRLKQIIKEELEISAHHDEMGGGDYVKDPNGYEGHMAKTNLFKIAEYAHELHEMIADDENLEPWVEEKIAVAAYMMDAVGHHMKYMKHRAHEDAEGEMGHADLDPHEREHEEEMGGREDEEGEFYGFEDDEDMEDEDDEEVEFEEGSEE